MFQKLRNYISDFFFSVLDAKRSKKGSKYTHIHTDTHPYICFCVYIYSMYTNRFNISERMHKKLSVRLPLERNRRRR